MTKSHLGRWSVNKGSRSQWVYVCQELSCCSVVCEGPGHHGLSHSWEVGLGCERKPVGSTSLWLLLQLLLEPLSDFSDRGCPGSISWNKHSSPSSFWSWCLSQQQKASSKPVCIANLTIQGYRVKSRLRKTKPNKQTTLSKPPFPFSASFGSWSLRYGWLTFCFPCVVLQLAL